MGLLDKLLGREDRSSREPSSAGGQQGYAPVGQQPTGGEQPSDEQAVQRYEYLLRTAPPEQIEQAHAEAFERLTPQQRQQVLAKLAQADPAEAPRDDSAPSLARSATRMEMSRPGTLRGAFGGGGGIGMGGMLLTTVAGAFIGTAIADAMFDLGDQGDVAADGADAGDPGGDLSGEATADGGFGDGFGDFGGGDFGGFDF